MADLIVKFHDAHVRPPRGGWHFNLDGQRLEKHSEADIIEEIRKARTNNGTFTDIGAIERELWEYYCSVEPSRCGYRYQQTHAPIAGPATAREVTKELQGPPIWGFLNTAAVQWTPSVHGYFRDVCDYILSILVCPDCQAEWSRTLGAFPNENITTRFEACQWVWTVHNAVNAKAGKHFYPYDRFVREWGAPPA